MGLGHVEAFYEGLLWGPSYNKSKENFSNGESTEQNKNGQGFIPCSLLGLLESPKDRVIYTVLRGIWKTKI